MGCSTGIYWTQPSATSFPPLACQTGTKKTVQFHVRVVDVLAPRQAPAESAELGQTAAGLLFAVNERRVCSLPLVLSNCSVCSVD
ncbi:unnamed protein product [Heligmosomoides polygyrus]|uniref:Uncharacterized protein n=1 Tax=Heligmosomoides polygyrus TaxID=6339 RepID=A0A183FPU1_HELPZ|nr:unnamed protein product [Heligmosomoides polygyrus]